jgi:hypothetical protein
MTRKDYMAGMAETLTKLYDGKLQKRILRKEIIEVREPVLIVFAGGIRNRVTGLLTHEHVSSGFIPRFIFVTAESNPANVRPLGPPTSANLGDRDEIRKELADIHSYYTQMQHVEIPTTGASFERTRKWEVKLSNEAWGRYNDIDAKMMRAGLDSERPDLMTPTYARLGVSGLKAATLLAASEQRDDQVVVEEEHLVHAFKYVETWRTHMHLVMNNIGKGNLERELDRIMKSIIRNEGMSRGQLMQNFHLTSRDTEQILRTLEERQQIRREKVGRGERLYSLVKGTL